MSRSNSRVAFRSIALVALVVALSSCFGPVLNPAQTEGLDRLNGDRSINRVAALPASGTSQAKAQAWAEQLARDNRIYHSTSLSTGIDQRWCRLGENVGMGPSIAAIEAAYMQSPGHKANILDARFNGAGVGVAYNGTTVFTVQEFIQTC